MKTCPAGVPIEKKNYETINQFKRRETKGLCSSSCPRKHGKGKVERPHPTLALVQQPLYGEVGEGITSQPKVKTERSEPFKAFIREQRCLLNGGRFGLCEGDVIPHHTEGGGMALKGSDLSCVPLCCAHHNLMDNAGKKGRGIWTAAELKATINRLHEAFNQAQADKRGKR